MMRADGQVVTNLTAESDHRRATYHNESKSIIVQIIIVVGLIAWGEDMAEAGINLVADGGFESGSFAPAWTTTLAADTTFGGNAEFVVDDRFPHEGNYGVSFISDPETTRKATLSQTLTTVAGQDYMLKFFAANRSFDRHDPQSFQVFFGGEAVTPIPVTVEITTDFTEYDYTILAAGTSSVLLFEINVTSEFSQNRFHLDDVSVTVTPPAVVPEPSSLVLCAMAGAVGLTIMRARRRRAGSA
jgi:hypothetical protein